MIVLAEPIDLDTLRARAEFLEMPGLCVTVAQAARLFGLSQARAAEILIALKRDGLLTEDHPGVYRRARAPS